MGESHVGKLIEKPPAYEWILDNSCIQMCKKVGDAVESPLIEIKINNGLKHSWILRFYPKGKEGFDQSCAPIVLVSKNNCKADVYFDLAIIQDGAVVQLFDEGNLVPFSHCNFEWGERLLRKNWIMDAATGTLKNNNLTILCRIRPRLGEIIDNLMGDISEDTNNDISQHEKKDDPFNKLVVDSTFGDFILYNRGKVFWVHEAILSRESHVFAGIFADQRGKNSCVAFIDDVDPDVFSQILKMMYFRDVVVDVNKVADLLAAADKYSLEKLFVACEKCMLATFGHHNVVQYLKLAHIHKMDGLKKKLVEFIVANSRSMLVDNSFESIKNLNPDLMYEIIKEMAKLCSK